MRQLDKVELFVCSEDATHQIGFADKVEVWTEGGSSHLILRGVNGVDKDAVLQAENECLRRDVEFYKKLWQARGGATTPVEQRPEVNERGPIKARQNRMTEYTADDFANAKFAEHPNPEDVDARYAARMNTDPAYPWLLDGVPGNTDEAMSRTGWVPVPTKPTITESDYRSLTRYGNAHYQGGFNDALTEFGIAVIPDPPPTDEELLAGIIRNIDDWQSITSPELLAKYLNTAGVTPPREDNA